MVKTVNFHLLVYGTGMYTVAAASTAMVIVCLEAMNFIHHHIFKHTPHESYDADENSDSSTEQSK